MTIGEQLQIKDSAFVTSFKNKYRKENFFKALREKNNKTVRSLISSGIDVNMLDDYGDPAIFVAIDNDDYKNVKYLINNNADINLRDHDGQTTLMHAAFIGSLEIAELLILNGVEVNTTDLLGQTALMMAAQSNKGKMGELLLLYGANTNIIDSKGKTAAAIAKETWYNRNCGNFFLSQLPSDKELSEKRIIHFFTYFFPNKGIGSKIEISEIKKIYLTKYNCNLLDKWIDIGIDYRNHEIYGYDYELKKQGNFVIYYPNKKEINKFLKKFFLNIKIGDVISIENFKKQFESFFKFEVEDYSFINKLLEKSSALKKLPDESYQYIPDELTKKTFLEKYLKNKGFGDVINIAKIQNDFCSQYKILLEESFLCNELKERHYEIQKLNAAEWKLLPDIYEKKKFLTSIFPDKYFPQKYTVNLEEIKTKFFNRFHCELKNKDLVKLNLNKDIGELKTCYEINILRSGNNFEIIDKNPENIEIYSFLNQFIADTIFGNSISLQKINESFFQKFGCYIPNKNKYQIYNCLNSLKNKLHCEFVLNNKCIQDINEIISNNNADVSYLIVPSETHIQKWVESIPYKCPFKLLNQNKDVVFWINNYCKDKGLEFRPTIHNSDDYILTYNETNIIDIISEELRDIFLHEDIGFSILKEDFLSVTKEKYDFIKLDNDILAQAFNNANKNLIDLQIIDLHDSYMSKSKIMYSSFGDVINTTRKQQCPICSESIALPYLKEHLLTVHTAYEKHSSIIEYDIQHSGCFKCNHCYQDRLDFNNIKVSTSVILGHLFSECKNDDFWAQKQIPGMNSETNVSRGEKIYTGSAYSNNSRVIGNSGHIYREHGRYGSYPDEDYYGDGDSVQ